MGGSGHVFDTMALEIEQLLSKVMLIYSCSCIIHTRTHICSYEGSTTLSMSMSHP